jgi:predicted YcjX-like family ATPase
MKITSTWSNMELHCTLHHTGCFEAASCTSYRITISTLKNRFKHWQCQLQLVPPPRCFPFITFILSSIDTNLRHQQTNSVICHHLQNLSKIHIRIQKFPNQYLLSNPLKMTRISQLAKTS